MKLSIATLFLAFTATLSAAEPKKPNVVFILSDDLGYMDVGCNNPKTFYETPNIDGLAKAGTRVTQGYAACPVCSPTRASIMTGKYPQRVGITNFIGGNRPGKLKPADFKDHLELDEVTVARHLKANGYQTFFAGKWHLGNDAYNPSAHGFGPVTGKNQFFYPVSKEPIPNPKDDPKTTERIANEAVKFIGENRDKPFFAYLPFLAVHIPIGAKKELIDKYEKKKLTAPADEWGTERNSKVRRVQNHVAYAAMLEQMDSAIGRVIDALEKNGLKDNTMVVFTSDNGGLSTAEGHPTCNLPFRGGKGWLYEGGIREPWIVSAPGITKPGSVCDTPSITMDFFPTILEWAGLPPMPKLHRDGVSLMPVLKGKELNRDAPLFWHYPHYGNQGGSPGGAVRDGDWKLIEWYEDGSRELYNIREDIGEAKNLAAQFPDKVKDLQGKLNAFRKDVGAVMPTPNPDWKEPKKGKE